MSTFFIGVSAWIIQDGNYTNFHVGEEARFALQFSTQSIRHIDTPIPVAERLSGNKYRIRARVAYREPSVWVVDFGVLAYECYSGPPEFAQGGSWVEGTFHLRIDPFMYFEELSDTPGIPELRYDWRVRRIWLETTPRLTRIDKAGETLLCRDEQNESFVEVAETNAWKDDEGSAHYILECERIG